MLRLKTSLVTLIFMLFFLFLQERLWFGHEGILQFFSLKNNILTQLIHNNEIKEENENLVLEIEQMKLNPTIIEAKARYELGMIKKGETFYQIVR